MLSNFFRINLPYGIAKNANGEWMAFNREYMPLGYNDESLKGDPGRSFLESPIYTEFKGLTEKKLVDIAGSENRIGRNDKNEITRIFLYHDGTNPTNISQGKIEIWNQYFDKLKELGKLAVK